MLSEELHAVTFALCPYDNLSIPVHACKDRLWFVQMLLYVTLKTAGFGCFFVKISVNKDNLWNSDRKQKSQRRPSVTEMILLQWKAVKIWPNLITWWGLRGWFFSVFDLCGKAEQGTADWEYWKEKEDVLPRFYQTRLCRPQSCVESWRAWSNGQMNWKC